MPKTASKRAEARRMARVQRAHQGGPARTVTRRVPAARRRARPRGWRGVLQNYPVASTIFFVLLVGLIVLIVHGAQIGPFAPAKRAADVQATCDLKTHMCDKAPLMTIDKNKNYVATIHTAKGSIVIQLQAKDAPLAVNNFVFLAEQHYYDNTYFWRVEKVGQPSPLNGQPSNLALIQGGSTTTNGATETPPKSPPGYVFKDDPITGTYTTGIVAMANSGPNTNGAQFFIDTGDDSGLPKNYDIFGYVTSGLNVAQQIQPNDKIESITIAVSSAPVPTPTAAATATATPAASATPTK